MVPLQQRHNTAHRSSLEWTPPCHGGDHRFESGMGRYQQTAFEYAFESPWEENLIVYQVAAGSTPVRGAF